MQVRTVRFSEAVRVKNFRRGFAVQGRARARGVVQPVVRIDEVDVIARTQDPSISELPAKDAGNRIVLKIVGDGNPGTELIVGVQSQERRREFSLCQLDTSPLIINVD